MPAARARPRPPPPAAEPKRRGRKKGAPRPNSDAILDACEELIMRQGYADTSLRQLMAAAGVSTTAFYARFPSRDAILEALASRFLGALAAEGASRLASSTSVEQGFSIGVDVLLEAVKGKRPLMRVLLGEVGASESMRKSFALALEQIVLVLEAPVARLVERGAIDRADASAVAWALVGALKIQLERWALYDSVKDAELGPALRSAAQTFLGVLKKRAR